MYVPPGHLTAQQTADALGIGLGGVRQLVRRGRLKKAGGTERHPYYASAAVTALIAQRHPIQRPLTRRSEPCNDLRAELCPQPA
ncbi:helix-turn-helix domain-containing protein [Streptomyces odonnellii]|uniref:helix-turn-helix domain-containing protein n=1 Tax=Streptomyces odonnellii TaxID=1417980 RepID=UPI00099B6A84|nr:helix-turn-helix domain-containing protein [Streptomyces odonnellii]